MKFVGKLLGISLLFLLLQQCVLAQEDTVAEAEELVEQLEDLLPADDQVEVDPVPEELADEAAGTDGTGEMGEAEAEAAEEDPRIAETEVADVAVPANANEELEMIPEVVCMQGLNEECIEDSECCQGYICHHRKKKCKSNGAAFAPLQPSDDAVINVLNDIID